MYRRSHRGYARALLKQHRISVRIPFARRIGFSNTANCRNPAMLFDLIKCHAALRFLQREREEMGGEVRIEANPPGLRCGGPLLFRDQPGRRAGLEDDRERRRRSRPSPGWAGSSSRSGCCCRRPDRPGERMGTGT
ncbi:hypothetical protein [Methanoculleus sp. UBA303]|uniref:hypothetical protein n=1 Tax=Methanoculleus sp. UBA303 TaxID=1915497 RepID=UPI0025F740AC|nr:hypothetical protein [Methanoculleus sp. UBA303]